MEILTSDAHFLAVTNMMDYSLLIGEIDTSDELILQELKEWMEEE